MARFSCWLLLGHVMLLGVPSQLRADDDVCARVTIRISQQAVITRTAFEATLEIENHTSEALTDVVVNVKIKDAAGNLSNNRFDFNPLTPTSLADVPPGGTLTAKWIIVAGEGAAPTQAAVKYLVGGDVSHSREGNRVTIPFYPVEIEVLPDAKLFLKYYLQSPVYSDNPFTTTVEPAEPFSLGLLVTNAGFGTARNMRITSAQPEIVRNDRDLLIAFQILGTQLWTHVDQLNGEIMKRDIFSPPTSPSLTVNLGDIQWQESAVGRWVMTASLQGRFIDYKASFERTGLYGNLGPPLIQNVAIFELNHTVYLDGALDDGLPDFLVDDPPSVQQDEIPDVIHASDGTVLPLHVINLTSQTAAFDGAVATSDLTVQLHVSVPQPGWTYIRAVDTGGDCYGLAQAIRPDGKGNRSLLVGGPGDVSNAWTTHRWVPPTGPERREDLVHLFDYFTAPGEYEYMLTYRPKLEASGFTVADGLHQRSNVTNVSVTFTAETNAPALIGNGRIGQAASLWKRSVGGAPAERVALSADRYSWDALLHQLTINLTVDRPGPSKQTILGDGNYELRLDTTVLGSAAGGCLTDCDGDDDHVCRFGDLAVDALFRFTGDTNSDRTVDTLDEQIVTNPNTWLKSAGQPGFDPNADVNGDGIVNFMDLQLVRSNWNKTLGF